MSPIVWIHGDCLSPYGPALTACPGAPAIFVFDTALLAERRVSLKRVVFLYECLLELPVTIRRGDVAAQVLSFAGEHGADEVMTTASPSPRFAAISRAIASRIALRALPVAPFVSPRAPLDLARFARYWRAVEADALRPPDP
jgi:deoxyribodipyrimidine photo-lyase